MSDTIRPESISPEQEIPESTAVRVFEHADTATEFPVLKAFQEYLEAEQAKAHKRMLSLSIFFIVLLVIVVLTFTIITSSVINRNQKLSDRLMDIVLRERTGNQPQTVPIVNVQQPTSDDSNKSVKPIMEKLEQLQSELTKARAEADVQKRNAADAYKAPPSAVQVSPLNTDKNVKVNAERDLRQLDEIRKQQAAIKAAREQLKAEQDALHKEQVEQHRRRLYPEYYAQIDAKRAAEEAMKNPPPALPLPQPQIGQQEKSVPLPVTPQKQQEMKSPITTAPAAIKPVEDKPLLPLQPNNKTQAATTSPKSATQKPSALQAILDKDDAPRVAPKTPELTAEETVKVQAELKNLMEQADQLEEEAKRMSNQKNGSKTPPLPEAKPKSVQQKGTQSLKVGGTNGKTIPWLISLPGDIPVQDNEDGGEKKSVLQQQK